MDSLDMNSLHDTDSQDGLKQPLLPSHTQCEISVLNEEGEYNFHDQLPTGRLYNPQKDYFVFKTQSVAADYLAFLIDFYTPTRLLDNKSERSMSSTQSSPHSSASSDSPQRPEDMTRVGFCYVLPSNMKDSWGEVLVPITSIHLQPIGQIRLHYMVIHPLNTVPVSRYLMDTTWTRHWKKRKAFNVGHRGMGNSYTKMSVVRENTIASLSDAAEHGADFVEFDVQLSKDRVPIIYHDFYVGVTIFRRPESAMNQKNTSARMSDINLADDDKSLNVHLMAVKDLKYKQLRLLKLTHETNHEPAGLNSSRLSAQSSLEREIHEGDAKAAKSGATTPIDKRESRRWDVTEESHSDDKDQLSQPFPRLDDVLQYLHPHVGVNIEIKYPLMQLNGEHECEHFFERNEYLDIILADVLEHAGQRRVLFSSFDPDICTMLKLKQNKYPVFFLTMGSYTTRYVPLNDLRCQNTYISMNFAHSIKLMGVNLHAEDVLKEPMHLSMAEARKLVVFVWGDDLDNKDNLKYLRDKGVDGLIYDRIDENDATMGQGPKRNVFAIEKALREELFRSRSRSPLTVDDSALESSKKSQSSFEKFLDKPPNWKEH